MKSKAKYTLLTSGLTLLLSLMLLAGVTYAWFAMAGSPMSAVIAGNLDIAVRGYDVGHYTDDDAIDFAIDSSPLIDNEWIEPGQTGTKFVYIENTGNLDLKYVFELEFEPGYNLDQAGLIEVLRYQVTAFTDLDGVDPMEAAIASLEDPDWEVDFLALDGAYSPDPLSLRVNTGYRALSCDAAQAETKLENCPNAVVYRIDYKMCDYAGNSYQEKTLGADISLTAIQAKADEPGMDTIPWEP